VPPLEAAPAGGGAGAGPGGAGPLVPESAAKPPVSGAGAMTPPGVSIEEPEEAEQQPGELVEATPASVVETGSEGPASPWIPIGIGLGVGLLALLVPLVLGRRYAW
jgi:hypothetical protein